MPKEPSEMKRFNPGRAVSTVVRSDFWQMVQTQTAAYPRRHLPLPMAMKFFWSVLVFFFLSALHPGYALDQSKQQIIDAFQAPFSIYLNALHELSTALNSANSERDVVKATDRFCDDANHFVDEFNATKDRFQGTPELTSLESDPEAKQAVENFMTDLKAKIEDAKPTFENLIQHITKFQGSPEIRRVRDRVSATVQRIQLINL